MADVQAILRSCTVLEFFCQLADEREGIATELEQRFNQLHAQTSRVLHCWTRERYIEDEDGIVRKKCPLELLAEVLTIAPDVAHQAMVDLTATVAIPGTVQISDRHSTGDNPH